MSSQSSYKRDLHLTHTEMNDEALQCCSTYVNDLWCQVESFFIIRHCSLSLEEECNGIEFRSLAPGALAYTYPYPLVTRLTL